jgi:WG containing repeat
VSASSFADGRALVSDNSLDLQGKYYFIDSSGKNPYQTSFFAALSYSDGLALVTRNKGDKPEFINLMGNRVSPLDFDASRAGYNSFNNGFLVISVQDSPLVAYVDKNFRRIVEFDATGIAPEIQEFSEGMLAIRRKVGRKWEYIDGNGNTVIPPVFLWTSEFRNGLASVSWADRKGRVHVGMVNNKKQLFYYDFSWRRGEYIKKQCVISSDEKTVECQ